MADFKPLSENQPLVRAREVTRRYMVEETSVLALDGASLEVAPGSFTALVGRSGSGKSTLLNLLAGLDRPDSGTLEVAGQRLDLLGERELTMYRRFTAGMVFQFFNLLPLLTTLENTMLPALLAGTARDAAQARAEALLTAMGLASRLRQQSSLLSGGEMQRVAIARALINDPQLLLADEPTGNLDSQSAAVVLEILQRVSAEFGKTVIMVTHAQEAAAAAGSILEMHDGRVVSPGG